MSLVSCKTGGKKEIPGKLEGLGCAAGTFAYVLNFGAQKSGGLLGNGSILWL